MPIGGLKMSKPLEGIRVLDLTNVLAGPFCCHQLAHMGGDVIEVETPGTGDLARQLGADPARNADLMGISFLAQNPDKRSITLNLKSVSGKRILKELVRKSDALIENFRPGVMARLNLDYDTLSQENPRLVYCAISGFVDIICLCMRGDFPSKGFFLVFTQQKLRLPCRICRGWFQHA